MRASRYRIAALTENGSPVFSSKLLPSAVQIAASKPHGSGLIANDPDHNQFVDVSYFPQTPGG
jgi:hypothetical protein